jgi:septal ring factor EnvC (AmiA/AmiB activator)
LKFLTALCWVLFAVPALAWANARHDAQTALDAHTQAAAAARKHQQEVSARAALLAEKQVQAAANLRNLEDQTAKDTAQLANLQAAQSVAEQQLAQAEAGLTKLLPVMHRLSSAPAATLLAAPVTPENAVRGIAVMQGIAASVATQAQTVQTQKAQLDQLIAATRVSQTKLAATAAAQQAAESALSAQIAAAKTMEMADADKAAAEAAQALGAQHKLDTLDQAVRNLVPPVATSVNLKEGTGGAPVAGHIVQRFGASTVAGPAQGISYGTAAGSRVVTPCAGIVMFAGPFPAYGLMVIMDCGGSTSVVLAGMSHLDVAQGQRLAHGQPIGSMQSYDPAAPTRQPVLYVELRKNGTPTDPAPWLAGGRSG